MNEWFLFGVGIFLVIVAVIDWKAKAIPSILLTGGLFTIIALNQDNIFYGLMAFVLSYLLYEANFFGGVADIKVFTLLGFLIQSFYSFGMFVVFFAIAGVSWKVVYKIIFAKKDENECPFLPAFVFVYFGLLIGGLL